ncbi:hypothetical protein F0562_011389 [Nyssa sinensis]|uniref:Uncharacterized protein n=1 Tax=Nyssa sinensis TaxID=561372 RepID=A0A5J5A264_9ASTE|nr:hypothetical protein F0562_011389 [Nyssa sinensis]
MNKRSTHCRTPPLDRSRPETLITVTPPPLRAPPPLFSSLVKLQVRFWKNSVWGYPQFENDTYSLPHSLFVEDPNWGFLKIEAHLCLLFPFVLLSSYTQKFICTNLGLAHFLGLLLWLLLFTAGDSEYHFRGDSMKCGRPNANRFWRQIAW